MVRAIGATNLARRTSRTKPDEGEPPRLPKGFKPGGFGRASISVCPRFQN
jgi:hypothetical protein